MSVSWQQSYREIIDNRLNWTVVLEKTLESPFDCKESQPVHSEGDQPWDFFGRNDAKAETPVLWPPHAKSWLIGKDSDAGRDWGQEEKGMTEDEMAGWHHWLDGRKSEWTLGVGDGQGGLACCDSWGREESDTTEQLMWSDEKVSLVGNHYLRKHHTTLKLGEMFTLRGMWEQKLTEGTKDLHLLLCAQTYLSTYWVEWQVKLPHYFHHFSFLLGIQCKIPIKCTYDVIILY